MDNVKPLERIIPPPPTHMVGDGFKVHNFFPNRMEEKRMSPFYLLDYNSKIVFPPSKKPRGVGPHPHRGFETVTIAFKGKVEHHDSVGNSGIIGEGDVQWMTAGSGILHKEYHEREFSQKGGEFQMVQLWVNLPAEYKMTSPTYQAIENKNFGKYILPNNNGLVDVIAGSFKNVKGAAKTFTPIEMYNCSLEKDAEIDLIFPAKFNTCILVIEGSIKVNNEDVVLHDHFCLFQNLGEIINVNALESTLILVLSGEPINEPIAAYGPFLMNNQEEIQQALDDFNSGKFGHLE